MMTTANNTKTHTAIKFTRIQTGSYRFTLEGREFQLDRSGCEQTVWSLYAVADGEVTDYGEVLFENFDFKREVSKLVKEDTSAVIEEWDQEVDRYNKWKEWGAAMKARAAEDGQTWAN